MTRLKLGRKDLPDTVSYKPSERFPLSLGALNGLHYFNVVFPVPSI